MFPLPAQPPEIRAILTWTLAGWRTLAGSLGVIVICGQHQRMGVVGGGGVIPTWNPATSVRLESPVQAFI